MKKETKNRIQKVLKISKTTFHWGFIHHMKKLSKRFHLNGHSIGFCPETLKLEPPYKTPSFTVAVKGLRNNKLFFHN